MNASASQRAMPPLLDCSCAKGWQPIVVVLANSAPALLAFTWENGASRQSGQKACYASRLIQMMTDYLNSNTSIRPINRPTAPAGQEPKVTPKTISSPLSQPCLLFWLETQIQR
jgi:hypothetical protein